jgi:hypothetical protein
MSERPLNVRTNARCLRELRRKKYVPIGISDVSSFSASERLILIETKTESRIAATTEGKAFLSQEADEIGVTGCE